MSQVKFFLYHLLSRRVFWETEDYGSSPHSCCWALPPATVLGKGSAEGSDHFKGFQTEALRWFIQQGVFNHLIMLTSATGTHRLPDDLSCAAGCQDLRTIPTSDSLCYIPCAVFRLFCDQVLWSTSLLTRLSQPLLLYLFLSFFPELLSTIHKESSWTYLH